MPNGYTKIFHFLLSTLQLSNSISHKDANQSATQSQHFQLALPKSSQKVTLQGTWIMQKIINNEDNPYVYDSVFLN